MSTLRIEALSSSTTPAACSKIDPSTVRAVSLISPASSDEVACDPTFIKLVPRGYAGLDRLDNGRSVLVERNRGRDLLVADGHDALAVNA